MAITDKQIANIQNLDSQAVLEIMHECAERLGLVTVEEYSQIIGVGKRKVYQDIKDKKKMHFEISGHVFAVINE